MNKRKQQDQNGKTKARILIIDDHRTVREGLIKLINAEPDLTVCAKAENSDETLNELEKHHIDLAIVGIPLECKAGARLLEKLKLNYPRLPVLILSVQDELQYVQRALQAGARGYAVKYDPLAKIISAIRRVLSGKVYISETAAGKLRRAGISIPIAASGAD